MKKIKKSFKAYLNRIGELEKFVLGKAKTPEHDHIVTSEDSEYLLELLQTDLKSSIKIFVISNLLMLFILFGLGVFLVYYHRNNLTTMGASLGLLLSLLPIVWKVRQLWLEMFIIKFASYVLQKLPPEQAAKFILHLYRFISKPFERKKP